MADGKDKKDKKPAPAEDSIEKKIMVWAAVFVLIGLVVLPAVLGSFGVNSSVFASQGGFKEAFIAFFAKLFTSLVFISIFSSLVFIVIIVYAVMRKNQIIEDWKASKTKLTVPLGANPYAVSLPGADAGIHGPMAQGGNERWMDIEQKINSANPADWRLAILEADIVLYDMLEQMGLPGKDLGEKLKSADRKFFSTLDEAWKAHKIRNVIAHEGSLYDLPYAEAKKVIDYYRRVFEEFYFI